MRPFYTKHNQSGANLRWFRLQIIIVVTINIRTQLSAHYLEHEQNIICDNIIAFGYLFVASNKYSN
jgi:hypothetical protein